MWFLIKQKGVIAQKMKFTLPCIMLKYDQTCSKNVALFRPHDFKIMFGYFLGLQERVKNSNFSGSE